MMNYAPQLSLPLSCLLAINVIAVFGGSVSLRTFMHKSSGTLSDDDAYARYFSPRQAYYPHTYVKFRQLRTGKEH